MVADQARRRLVNTALRTGTPSPWEYTPPTDGRAQYMQHTVDFGVSEIPFQDPAEPGQQVERPDRPFAYLPIVAGGTSFMYHLTQAGKQVRDLKLSGDTLARIYTGEITRWSDARITAD